MLAQTLDILQRTKALLGDHSNWFETIGHWYKTTTLPRKLIVDLLKSNRGRDRIAVAVNGHGLPAVSEVTDAAARRVTWLLPSNRLHQGPNTVAGQLDPNAMGPLILRAVSFEQDYHLAWQTVFLTDPEPRAAANLSLMNCQGGHFNGRHWSVDPGGVATFKLILAQPGPVNFTLHLAQGRANLWLTLMRDVADELRREIREALKEKLWRLKAQILRALRNGEPQASHLQDDYQLLSAYQRLHQLHIDPAFEGPPDTSLAEIITQAGSPEELIRDLMPGSATDVTPGMLEEDPVLVKPARTGGPKEVPQVLPAPPRQPGVPRRAPTQPRAPARSGGMGACSCLFLLLFVGLVVVAVGGVIAFQFDPVKDWVKQTFTGVAQPPMGQAAAPAIDALAKSKNASTGEVQVTLYWTNKNDLDLHVVPPSGKEIYFEHRQEGDGKLDVDMNVKYEAAVAPALENIFWPQGKAPKGVYKVYVVHFNNHRKADCQDPTPYTIRVVVRGVTRFFSGEISFEPERKKVFVHEFKVD